MVIPVQSEASERVQAANGFGEFGLAATGECGLDFWDVSHDSTQDAVQRI